MWYYYISLTSDRVLLISKFTGCARDKGKYHNKLNYECLLSFDLQGTIITFTNAVFENTLRPPHACGH